jgi:hypothetical protein
MQVFRQLYEEMRLYSSASGIRYWFAAMEAPLARLATVHGIPFMQLGEAFDYYGPVNLYLADIAGQGCGSSKLLPQSDSH